MTDQPQQPQTPSSTTPRTPRTLYLCGAPQSSGSTLVSWCFLQRADMDGVLDARNDLLPELPPIGAPNMWCKFTISSFRLLDVTRHFEDEGWTVRPILVARDLRAVLDSLITKPYGRNGVTAEEPPLRTRLRRFHEDWKCARQHGWPVIKYEDFVTNPESALRAACGQLGLPWDEQMITWPKQREQIAAPGHGSPTFRMSRGGNLGQTLNPELCLPRTAHIPHDDLVWMEEAFADYNGDLGYAEHVDGRACPAGRAVAKYEHTRRYRREQRPMRRLRKAISRWWSGLRGRAPSAAAHAVSPGGAVATAPGAVE
jgi:hypothetical protein